MCNLILFIFIVQLFIDTDCSIQIHRVLPVDIPVCNGWVLVFGSVYYPLAESRSAIRGT